MTKPKLDLPIQCFNIDHYTLIVPNAKVVSDFHQNVLGYKLINTILVNAGSASEGKHDMLNYVLGWPNNEKGVMVVTEGLTKESIFHKFYEKFGQGIHHVAFEVDDIEDIFELLVTKGIEMTSDKILRDPLSGLRQFFISNKYAGVFIELIERKSETEDKTSEKQGFFTHDNMSGLANTMKSYLDDPNLKNDDDIKSLDKTNYFEVIESIEVDRIDNIQINVAEVQSAKKFLNSVLGFSIEGEKMINPNEKDKFLSLSEIQESQNGVIPVELALKTFNFEKSKNILESLNLDFKVEGEAIRLEKEYAGYPLTLLHD
ncbi:VOC family protein [Flavobacterium amniphilum]|uniref:VOC family protein n=1 Tax=Flavobacterium amniphilum TaxID=1834035 RepID=UPI00202AA7B1|nr:VOC family protein [Flavobacterium amniphilum]MCL9804497.1 VOC family protein [Flavobacterium amniphilum]